MRAFTTLLALAALFAFAGLTDAAPNTGIVANALQAAAKAKGKGDKKLHGVHGVVIDIERDKDKDTGSITLLVHHHKKGEKGKGEEEKRTFRLDEATKFFKLVVEKGQKPEREPASFQDVHKGEHVVIDAEKGEKSEAKVVEIVLRKGSKK
jgi:hypothetical protein